MSLPNFYKCLKRDIREIYIMISTRCVIEKCHFSSLPPSQVPLESLDKKSVENEKQSKGQGTESRTTIK